MQAWRTVRVFISSTFKDMHAERDHLVKVVFPELRERCADRRLHLVDLDLRWGVTEEEAEQGKVLEVILDEIDRSRPFFIAILGERYGHVLDKVTEDAEFAHPWLQEYLGHSITGLEIVHGVLRKPALASRSFFYFRDPQFISQVPESKRSDFTAENPEAARKLAALKDKIRASGRPVMKNYPCRWDDGVGCLVGLDVFGQKVLEDLWTAIRAEYPEAPEADPLAIERQMHEAFVEERSYLHIGRMEQATRLAKYVQGTDRRPTVITGESGCGKSAFLASWYRRYTAEHLDDFVLAYFIGASPDSTNHLRLLRSMCQELKHQFALKEEIPEEDKKLPETLAMLLVAASRGRSRIVLMLDALDQLSPLEGAHGLGWLLDYMPEKARLVVSTLEGDCLDVLRRREAEEITLPPLTADEQRQIVQALLAEWRRKLDERQMAALLAHPGVKNPLYLRVALEELRLFGLFEQLTPRINSLAEDIPRLFDQVLERLEKDHGPELATEAFTLVGCSRYGLSEAELLGLLAREGEEQFPRVLWARLARSAKAYLLQRGELLDFFQRQLGDAVATRYLSRDNRHAKLAAYFELAPLERKLDEYPYQLQHAEQWQALADALSDLDFFAFAWEHNRKYEWMGYWRSLEGRFDPGPSYQAALKARQRMEGESKGVARLLNDIGLLLDDMGLYHSALPFLRRAVEMRRHILTEPHVDVANSLSNLAALYARLGKHDQALRLYKEAVQIDERTLPTFHPFIAIRLNNLASLYTRLGKYDEGLSLYRRALAICEYAPGSSNLVLASILSGLAALKSQQGKYAEALPLLRRALAVYESNLNPDHPDIAVVVEELAHIYEMQDNYVTALPLYRRTLAIRECALGPDHPEVAQSLNNLGWLYYEQGNYDEALPLCQQALAIYEHTLDSNHPHVASSLNDMALLYEAQGDYTEAIRLLRRAVSIAEAALGADHPNTKVFRENLKACQDAMR